MVERGLIAQPFGPILVSSISPQTNHLLFFGLSTPQLYFHMVLSNTHILQADGIIVHTQPLAHSASQMEGSFVPHFCGLLYHACTRVPLRTSWSRNSREHTSNPFYAYQMYLITENFMNEAFSDDASWSQFANKRDRTALFEAMVESRVPSKDEDVCLTCDRTDGTLPPSVLLKFPSGNLECGPNK